nr:retinol dehydrogenase 13-like [Cherax quadricarinatus]
MKWNIPKNIIRFSAVGSLVGGVILFKETLGGSKYNGSESLNGKTVIITGANTGIGKETALEMALRHARVIMACRDMDKCREARKDIALASRNKYIYCQECDLASQESIRNFAKMVNEKEARVDILINNAGVMRCKKSFTKEGIELQFGTNHIGHFLLTNLLLDKLKVHKKMGLCTGVTSNAIHPGIVFTDIGRHMGINNSWIAKIFLFPLLWLFLKTPRQGAQTTIYAALNSELENVSGKYFSNKAEAEVSEAAQDRAAAKRLWAISEHWTGLT